MYTRDGKSGKVQCIECQTAQCIPVRLIANKQTVVQNERFVPYGSKQDKTAWQEQGNLGKVPEQWVDIRKRNREVIHLAGESQRKGGNIPNVFLTKSKACLHLCRKVVTRKRAVKQGVGGKPSNVSTFARKKKKK